MTTESDAKDAVVVAAENEKKSADDRSTNTTAPSAPAAMKPSDPTAYYSLHVKPEYVLETRAQSLPPLPVVEKTVGDSRDTNRNANGNNKKKNRGRNKKRPRDVYITDDNKICLAVMRGEECPYGADKCRFSHDLKAYLSTRPPDIQVKGFLETCPTFERLGRCQFGCMCRFGDCHINKATGANLEKTPPPGVPAVPQVKNAITVDLRTQLRKNTYPFVCQRNKHQQRGAKKQEPNQSDNVKTGESSSAAPTTASASAGGAAAATETETSSSTNGVASSAATAVNFSPLPTRTRKIIDFSNKVYVAPLSKCYCSCCEC